MASALPVDPPPVTDHRGLRILGLDECLRRLGSQVLGRLAFVHDGEPVILPITLGLDRVGVVFRSSWGSKLQAAIDDKPVALEVDDVDTSSGTGWSVVVKGTASVVYDPELVARWEDLRVPDWLPHAEDSFWVRINPLEITGREILRRQGP